ncbi:acyl-CoA--sterol O-acyltransferase 1-like [Impatiens glandulifera]|uniref:acyl-CoA--sterol O-acyltransferase 1-like n=1 Tax=Impatiens glandulifera TaxID=253017 RepID=UPI001FB0F51A|nr:acyl-CoA--sterol O-acyltransferase 1-like [Impatiens glandulifera]
MAQEIYYEGYTLDGEFTRFIKVWISVFLSLSYSFAVAKLIPKGILRLVSFLPIISLFFFLPLNLHSMHLGGTSAFFIAWLANFKLILYAFNTGPLSDQSLSLPKFLAVACFPIKIQNQTNSKQQQQPMTVQKPVWSYAIKVLVMVSLTWIYRFTDRMHPNLLRIVYLVHIYSMLELILGMVASLVQICLGLELEAQFNEPYLSTSLQDFWGRRWNIMVSGILRPTVYDPCLRILATILDRKVAAMVGVFATFVVSGIMHELIFFYFRRSKPTWVVMWFFVFHGFCLSAEIAVKKAVNGRFRVAKMVVRAVTVVFVMVTGFWWFLPELLRCHAEERSFTEYRILGEMVNGLVFNGF